ARALRVRSMSRHTRPTTVVSHAPRLATPETSRPLACSQDCWTASSASASEPSIRYATARSAGRCASKRSAVTHPRSHPWYLVTATRGGQQMSAIVSTIDIARPPDEVFAYVTDPARFPEWQDDVVRVQVAGSRFTTTRRIGRAERTMTQEITAV